MTLVEEGRAALRGCLRLLRSDPQWADDLNVSAEGFWRSFSVVLPQALMAYPQFIAYNGQLAELYAEQNLDVPPLNLTRDYVFLVVMLILWPLVVAGLTRILGVGTHFARYIIVYNWMSLPVMAIALIPALLYLSGAIAFPAAAISSWLVLILSLALSWIIARRALDVTAVFASAFMLADFALTQAVAELLGR